MNLEEVSLKGNKGGECNIVGALSGEGLCQVYSPWSQRRRSLLQDYNSQPMLPSVEERSCK